MRLHGRACLNACVVVLFYEGVSYVLYDRPGMFKDTGVDCDVVVVLVSHVPLNLSISHFQKWITHF